MGMQAEFNWYIVIKEHNVVSIGDDQEALNDNVISLNHNYQFVKDGYRIYPMETPLPLLYNGKCLAIAMIKHLSWQHGKTFLEVEPIYVLEEDDAIREHYEYSFQAYKRQQETLDDGGKVNLMNLVSPHSRTRI